MLQDHHQISSNNSAYVYERIGQTDDMRKFIHDKNTTETLDLLPNSHMQQPLKNENTQGFSFALNG